MHVWTVCNTCVETTSQDRNAAPRSGGGAHKCETNTNTIVVFQVTHSPVCSQTRANKFLNVPWHFKQGQTSTADLELHNSIKNSKTCDAPVSNSNEKSFQKLQNPLCSNQEL